MTRDTVKGINFWNSTVSGGKRKNTHTYTHTHIHTHTNTHTHTHTNTHTHIHTHKHTHTHIHTQWKDVEGASGWVQSRGWTDMNPAMPLLDCLREGECADICRMSSLPCE